MNELLNAKSQIKHHRVQGLEALNKLFRSGTPPETPLDGRYRGELVALDLGPGLTQMSWSRSTTICIWERHMRAGGGGLRTVGAPWLISH